ncbi:MAG: DoxX family protein [Ferruginibacter sp.]
MMVFSAYRFLTTESIKAAFIHLGLPSYFRVELAVAKIPGAIVIILPLVSIRFKEIAYTGFALTFISAFIAHFSFGDPASVAIIPSAFPGILIVSYSYLQKTKKTSTVTG